MGCVVHVVAARVRADVEVGALDGVVELARGLVEVEDARAVAVGRSEEQLIVATWLRDRASMERFASSAAHMAFIMRGVASVTSGMWSAAAETDVEPPVAAAAPAEARSMWVFGVHGGDEVYEWEVRGVLDDVGRLDATAACGSTFEERDRFRAAGVLFASGAQAAEVEASLSVEVARWAEGGLRVEIASAPVVALERRAS